MSAWKFLRRALKLIGLTVASGLLLVIASIAVAGWLQPDSATLPEPTGPYAVGRMFYDWTEERLDPFAPGPGTKRELTVWVWYPAEKDTRMPAADYLPQRLRTALEQRSSSVLIRLFGTISQHLTVDIGKVHVHAVENAPVVQTGAPFPVVLFKPALGYLALQHTSLMEDLASHGYVVVASDSPHTTPVVVYEDGRVANRNDAGAGRKALPDGNDKMNSNLDKPHPLAPGQPNGLLVPVVREWANDNRFLLDRLAVLNASDPATDSSRRLAGRLDLESVGAYGHSVGGAAALQFCSADKRCKAGIDIDGAVWGEVVRTGIEKPFLFIFSDRPIFKTPAAAQPPESIELLNALASIRSKVPNRPSQLIIEGTSHFNFTDYALFNELHVYRMLGAYGPIDPQRALSITNRHVRAFFDSHLKHRPIAMPTKDAGVEFPEVRPD